MGLLTVAHRGSFISTIFLIHKPACIVHAPPACIHDDIWCLLPQPAPGQEDPSAGGRGDQSRLFNSLRNWQKSSASRKLR